MTDAETAANEAAWPKLTKEQRATARLAWRATQEWNICPHPDCPPWDCRLTGP